MQRGDWVRAYGGPSRLIVAPGEYFEARCYRCGDRGRFLLPVPLTCASAFMRAFGESHRHCRQTLLGARWELTHLLHRRVYGLTHPGKE